MIFGLFDSKKKKESVSDLLSEVLIHQKLVAHIGKAQSLKKLDRFEEMRQVMLEAERMVSNYLNRNPREKRAHMLLVLFYCETGLSDRAEPIIKKLLNSSDFQLEDDERLILSGELQKIQRQRPLSQRTSDSPDEFTQIYCCANCGRLHNFVSMPCPHCDWSPQSVDETARSIVLSNAYFDVPTLLVLAREIGNGRAADDVVLNLAQKTKSYLDNQKKRADVSQVFTLLRQNEEKNHRSLNMVRECANCGEKILQSCAERCQDCGEWVNWPDAIRTIACLDNLLWLFEHRVEVSSNKAFSEFVCVMVVLTNNLLRKQESPSDKDRQYCLQLLAELEVVCDRNNGAMIETKDPRNLKIYFVKDCMLEDSENYGQLLFSELSFFVTKMSAGVKH